MNKQLSVTGSKERVELRNIKSLRLAFFLAGTLIILGVAGTYFINPYFLLLPLAVSGGLYFSAVTGWCPMALLMERFMIERK